MRYKNARVSEIDTKIKEIIEKNLIREESGDVTIQRGIVFYGDVGRGKTYAMYAIRNGLTAVKGNQSEVKTWQEFLFAMKLHYSDPKTNRNELENLKDKAVIYIDDLGVEKDTEYTQEMLYMIINHCYVQEKALFITTNLSIEELNEKYTERITSRLLEMCDIYQMTGDNKRI